MYGMIYVIRNMIDDKMYVGQTIRSFKERYPKGIGRSTKNDHLKRAIEKYGEENFYIYENYYEADTKEELDDAEIRLIAILDTTNPEHGYNHMSGGHNGKHDAATRAKIAEANRRRIIPHGKDNPRWSRVEAQCSTCGKPIYILNCIANTDKYKKKYSGRYYCSKECRIEGSRRPRPDLRKRIKVKCSFCQKEFELRPSEVASRKNAFCSLMCRDNYQKTAFKGSNNPNYGNHKVAGGNNGRAKKVRCVDTGEVFDCARNADKKYGLSSGSVSATCRGNQKTAAGLKWEFV